MVLTEIQNIYIEALKIKMSPKEFMEKVVNLYFKDSSISCANVDDYKIPENKEKEFCEHVSFLCWEDRCRGYRILRSEDILNYIKFLNQNKMNRIDIINSLIKKNNYKSYLEIGVQAGHCFGTIECEQKVGVDPDTGSAATQHTTSDDYFASIPWNAKFDIIFVDGLHVAEYVIRDIKNSLDHLNKGGIIVMHDCLPTSKVMQLVPDPSYGSGEWTGDTWKAFLHYRTTREDLEMCVVDTDYGCGIIRPGKQNLVTTADRPTYEDFCLYKYTWMNIISIDEFKRRFL